MKVLITYGTRPEILKLIPVILELRSRKGIESVIVNTGQHREMVQVMENTFKITPDYSLDIMRDRQSLVDIYTRVMTSIEPILEAEQPDIVLLQGDTSTVAAAGTVCFYKKIPVAHVEAGLRSFDLDQPFPEEFNRRLVSIFARVHFAPTRQARQNLLNEGVNPHSVFVTGNTIVDMIDLVISSQTEKQVIGKQILVTAHRRENHDTGLMDICRAIRQVSDLRRDVEFIWPVHPNPLVKKIVEAELTGMANVTLVEPLEYFELLFQIQSSYLVWTDSGGIQEECPALKKPVLILRNVTERPEVVESGFGVLVGTDPQKIVDQTLLLLNDSSEYQARISGENPFGDGTAAKQIADILIKSTLR